MERLCFFINLSPGSEPEYERLHAEMSKKTADTLSQCGFANYTLFRRGLTVVGYAECHPTIQDAFTKWGASEDCVEWNAKFDGIIESMTDESGAALLASEVWHLP
jgi:L-rhamnose mutarotase